MRKPLLFAAAAVLALPGAAAAAETDTAPPPLATADAEAQGVIAYPADFFAAAQLNTAHDMVMRLPGFVLDQGSGVRGFAGAAGNVLVDGDRPTTKSDDLVSLLRRIPASQVERIDIIRGGAPGIDMQGKTVLANIVRKKGSSVTGLVSVVNQFVYDGRNAPGIRLEGARRGDGKALEGSLVMAGFTDDGVGDGDLVQRDASGALIDRAKIESEGDGGQYVGTAAYETPLAGGKFRINGRAFFQRFYFGEHDSFELSPVIAKDRELEERLEGEVGLRYGRDLGSRTKLETLFIQQWKKQDFGLRFQAGGDEELYNNARTLGETIGRASVNFRQSDTLSFEAGGEGAFNWLESETDYSVNGTAIVLPAANVRVEEKRGEVFGTATWKPWSTLSLETGLRYEYSQIMSEGDVVLEKSLQFAKPRLVATWSPNAANQLRFRVEREVSQLNFGDFVSSSQISNGGSVTTGNPDLDPQQAWVVEAAWERRFWGSGAVTLTLRHFELTDAIDRAPVVVVASCPLVGGAPDLTSPLCTRFDQPANIGDGSKDQAQLDFTLPLEKLGLKGATLRGFVVWRDSEVSDPTTFDPRQISGERPREWELHFTQDVPSRKFNWGVDVFGAWEETYYRYNRIETTKLRTFVVPFIEYKPRRDIMLLAQLQNATQRDLVRVQDLYAGPRDLAPLAVRDRRQYDNGMMLYLRFRKTFG